MRRKRMSCVRPSIFILRNGDTASVMARKRSTQSPVACSRNWVGFAPQPLGPSQARMPMGIRHSRNTTTFVHLLVRMRFIGRALVIFLQVHAVVQTGDLISVPVEHLGWRGIEEFC